VTDGFAYSVTPQIGLPEGVAALGSASIAQAAAGGADAVRPLLEWARGVEDPARQLPDSVDCASCHLANRVGRHIERAHPEAATGLPQPPPRTLGGAEQNNDNLRAFGYFDTHPAVSQRTANETAAVLAALRAM
jgi:hypothetical protein